jgi:TonB-linked SusC/RagA family outer membrane protein
MQKSNKLISLCIVALFFLNVNVYAQQSTVTGTVTDSDGETLIGVAIIVKGTTIGTTTDVNGKYTISVPSGSNALTAKYIGMKEKAVAISGPIVDIVMEEDNLQLEEVVVIGYGAVRKKDLTGAVSSVGENVLKNIPVTSAASAITGRLAGVSVITTEGSPDATINVRVRGGGSISQDNSPLFIVDGFQVSNIDDVPPGDIESMHVLKDASSTAIYGAKGANGVILVTTRSGRAGKTTVRMNTSIGFSDMYNETPVLSPYEYVYLQRELDLADNAGFFKYYGRWEDIDIYKSRQGTNWQRKLYGETGVKQNYNLSVSGGDQSLSYSISYTRDDESYIMKTSKYLRDNLNIKIDKTFGKYLRLEFNPKMSRRVINGASVSSGRKLRDSVKFAPVNTQTSISLDDAENGYNLENISNLNDPYFNVVNEYKKQIKFSNSYNAALTWNIFKGLSLRTEGIYGFLNDRTDQIYLKNTGEANQKAGQPVAYRTYWDGNNWTARGILNYNNKIKEHYFDAMAAIEYNHSVKDRMVINSDYFPHDYTAENILAMWNNGKAEPTYTTIEEPSRTKSYFGRANYIYRDRYYATFTLRADGTNVFAPGKKWGMFPAGSIAWRVSEENFMQVTKNWMSNMKIRASYGLAGNARVGSYWRQTYNAVTNTKNLYYVNETGQSSLQPGKVLRNENLSWETKYSTNLGFDFGFLNNRIGLTVDYYKDVTKDLIMQVDLPSNSGYENQYQNLGQTTNKGLEITLNGTLISRKDFFLDMNFNISFNKNRVDALYGREKDQMIISGTGLEIGSDNYRIVVGEEIGLMYGYVSDGMYSFDDFTFDDVGKKWVIKEGVVDCLGVLTRAGNYYGPGHMKLKDLNGDGKINADNDRRIVGHAQPKHTGGFNLMTGWKGFDLVAMFNWSYGNDIMNVSKVDYNSYAGTKRYQNMTTEMSLANRFTFIDPATGRNIYTGDYANPELLQQLNANARYWHPMTNATVMTDWAVEDGSFLRLGNLTLGYTFPKEITRRFAVENLRLYGTVNNVFCLTSYSGQDPEVSTSGSNLSPGIDDSAYPKSRTCIFGINVTF